MTPRVKTEEEERKRRLTEIKQNLKEARDGISFFSNELKKATETSRIRDLKRQLGRSQTKYNRWSKKWMEEAQGRLPF